MSGGSYNYLFCHTENLTEHRGDLNEMAARLNGLSWAQEAAATTKRVQALLDEAAATARSLEDVWRAVEWWDSGDWGEGQVRSEIAKWLASSVAASESARCLSRWKPQDGEIVQCVRPHMHEGIHHDEVKTLLPTFQWTTGDQL